MNKNGDKVTIREVYQLVDHKIGEVNSSILRLETKFDALEAGRLTSLEKSVAALNADLLARRDQKEEDKKEAIVRATNAFNKQLIYVTGISLVISVIVAFVVKFVPFIP